MFDKYNTQKKYTNRAITTALTTLFLMGAVSIPVTAAAQDAPDDQKIEEIIVTGSRIKVPNLESASPITSLDSAAMAYTGKTSVQDIVSEIGSLVGSTGDDETSNGENFLNLRNLGVNRTLTLVDGQRFVSGSSGGGSGVDTNSIPLAMIERVDVLTGGASAIYGADAVTGVVNFIMKKDFEGLALDAQYGDAQHGDFSDQQYSITAGHNFDEDRGNITLSYTYGHRPVTLSSARPEASTELYERIFNQNGNNPKYVLQQGTNEAFFTNGGSLIDPFGGFSSGYNGDGTAFRHGKNVGSFAGTGEIGGDGLPNYILFANGIRPGNDRHIVMMNGHYDVSESFRPYFSVNYSNVKTQRFSQHSLTVGSRVAQDNAFLPTSVVAAAATAGYTGPIFFNRWDIDAGIPENKVHKKTYRIILGAEGDISDNLRYDFTANFGQTKRNSVQTANRLFDRYTAAMDAVDDGTGKIVCRSTINPSSYQNLGGDFIATSFDSSAGPLTFKTGAGSGCTPFNPFTSDNSVNKAALAWIWQPTSNQATNTQTVLTGYIAGNSSSLFELQGGAVEFIVGGEYRKEKTTVVFDQLSGTAQKNAFSSGAGLSGEFDVKEGFVEISIPLFSDAGTLLNALTIDGAFRYSDYSTIGSTSTWKAGLIWEPVDSLSIRGTISSAVRAPNMGELFAPQTSFSTSLGEDPCNISNVNNGSSSRKANCATALNALGVDPTTFAPLLGTFFPGLRGGSPDLKEETANTKTIGFIWRPNFIEGLTISADYYNIAITDAVITPNQTAIFNSCYDAETLDNVFCSLLKRNSTTGAASFIELQAVNVARIETSGIEFSVGYGFDTDSAGDFNIAMSGTYLDKLLIQKTELPTLTDDKALFNTDSGGSSPTWVLNFDLNWHYDDWDINYGINYQSSTLRSPLINEQRAEAHTIIDTPFVKAYVNHDLQIGYTYSENTRFYVGIRNLTNEYPDKVRASLNGSSGRQSYAGRVIYAGVNLKFDNIWN